MPSVSRWRNACPFSFWACVVGNRADGVGAGIRYHRAPHSGFDDLLGLGLLCGERGLGLLRLDEHHHALEIIATLGLALVLFLDAVNMQVDELRHDWLVPILALGPGSLLTIGGIADAASLLLGMPQYTHCCSVPSCLRLIHRPA